MKKFFLLSMLTVFSLAAQAQTWSDCTVPAKNIDYGSGLDPKLFVCHNVVDLSQLQFLDCTKVNEDGTKPELCQFAKNWFNGELIDCTSPVLTEFQQGSCGTVIDPKTAKKVNCLKPDLNSHEAEICKYVDVNYQLLLMKLLY